MYNYNIDEKYLNDLSNKLSETLFSLKDEGKNMFSTSVMSKLVEVMVNAVIRIDFDMFMGYKRYEHRNGLELEKNYRNGGTTRLLKTTYGHIKIKIPRERSCMYYPNCIQKYKRRTNEFTNTIMQLFSSGSSNAEVVEFLSEVFDTTYTPQNISKVVEVLSEVVAEFKSRPLDSEYIAIYIDATYIPIQFDSKYEKQALHLLVGINSEGYQDILGYNIGFSENQTLWAETLEDIQNRGVKSIDLFISDGVVGMENTILKYYPKAKLQTCIVHKIRNIKSKAKVGDKEAIAIDLSNLFKMTTIETFDIQKEMIKTKWNKYSKEINNLFNNPNLFTYLDYPPKYQPSIRTTNRIEGINQKIKVLISHKQQFPNVESFERILVAGIIKLNNKTNKKIVGYKEYVENLKKSKD